MKVYDLTISIVLYQPDIDELKIVLSCLYESVLSIKIYLIDNSLEPLKDLSFIEEKPIEYIFNHVNLGFGMGHNVAIKKAKTLSKYHLVLNSDTYFKGAILNDMYKYLEQKPEIGVLGPKVLNEDGTLQYSCKLLPTPINLIVRRFLPIKKFRDRLDYTYELKHLDHTKIREVPSINGCFLFFRMEALSKIRGFDKRFFIYLEDIDLIRRIADNYKVIYYSKAEIIHKHGRGSYHSYRLLKYHVISAFKYFNKWGWFFDKTRTTRNKNAIL